MNKKRIRQMTGSLLRRVTTQPAVRYLGPYRAMLTELLEEQGVGAEVVKLSRIAPLDPEPVVESVKKTGRLLVLEDCNENGSVGQQLAAALAEAGIVPKTVVLKNLKNAFAPQGTVAQLRALLGLDAQGVVKQILETL